MRPALRPLRRRPADLPPWLVALPNALTTSRLVFAAAFIWLMSLEGPASSLLALAVFGLAALTDLFDGLLARRFGLTSPYGIFMDPLADKVLVLSALFVFLWQNLVPPWMVLAIVGREFIVTALRSLAEARGVSLPAAAAGKRKMLSQTVAILAVLAAQGAQYLITARSGLPWDTALARAGTARLLIPLIEWVPWSCLLVATVLSLTSGADFVWRHRWLFRAEGSPAPSARPRRRGRAGWAAEAVATFGFTGRLPLAPGTWGTLAALAVFAPLRAHPLVHWLLLGLLLSAGLWAADAVARASRDPDPARVVVDEVVATGLILAAAPGGGWRSLLAAFVLFRLLDILKPPPLRRLERLPGGVGILADDLGAALIVIGILKLAGW